MNSSKSHGDDVAELRADCQPTAHIPATVAPFVAHCTPREEPNDVRIDSTHYPRALAAPRQIRPSLE